MGFSWTYPADNLNGVSYQEMAQTVCEVACNINEIRAALGAEEHVWERLGNKTRPTLADIDGLAFFKLEYPDFGSLSYTGLWLEDENSDLEALYNHYSKAFAATHLDDTIEYEGTGNHIYFVVEENSTDPLNYSTDVLPLYPDNPSPWHPNKWAWLQSAADMSRYLYMYETSGLEGIQASAKWGQGVPGPSDPWADMLASGYTWNDGPAGVGATWFKPGPALYVYRALGREYADSGDVLSLYICKDDTDGTVTRVGALLYECTYWLGGSWQDVIQHYVDSSPVSLGANVWDVAGYSMGLHDFALTCTLPEINPFSGSGHCYCWQGKGEAWVTLSLP